MNEQEIRRYGLLLILQTEVEVLKTANARYPLPTERPFDERYFSELADKMRNVIDCPMNDIGTMEV